MERIRKRNLQKSIVALALLLLACSAALYDSWSANPDGIFYFDGGRASRQLSQGAEESSGNELSSPPNSFSVCGRAAGSHSETWSLQQTYATCPQFDPQRPTLILEGYKTWGRTGNRLRSFLHAVQYTRDTNTQLGIMYNSWAMGVLLKFFMAGGNDGIDDEWESRVEKLLCVKIFHKPEELQGWRILLKSQEELFKSRSYVPYEQYVASQLHTLRTLFQHYNTGEGRDQHGDSVGDMCSGIDSLFATGSDEGGAGEDPRSSAEYSVIHLRSLEGEAGFRILGKVASRTGCDPVAALEMEPEYVKSILEPLGMLEHPIVIIWDGQNKNALDRLMGDPDMGPMARVVPEEARWFGGDVTLAVMANVFIGNPASTMSGFIARSRVALGFGNNYVYRAKDKQGKWTTTCGDKCLFKYPKSGTYTLSLPLQSLDVPKFEYHPPLKSRISMESLKKAQEIAAKERESEGDTAKLRIMAHGSKVYTGLHPNEVVRYPKKKPVATRAYFNVDTE